MNHIDEINIINCKNKSKHKFNKNEIAFVIYSNILDKDVLCLCNTVYELLEMGKWITWEQNIKFYVVENSLEILKLETKNSYNKTIYIMSEDISNENIMTKYYRKMYDINEQDETILCYTSYNCVIYSCYERKLDKTINFNPYGSVCFYDIDKLVDENIFIKIEEIFAKENYSKKMLNLYRKINFNKIGKALYSDLGFEFCTIKNDISINKNIISIINNKFETNFNKLTFQDCKIENHMNSFIEIFKVIYDNKLNNESINKLEKYISEIENKLGNYIMTYSIKEEENHIKRRNSINPFYINCGTWCLVYENGILIISCGSNE